MNLSEWLHYLENRHVEPIQLGLERIRTVAQLLNLLPLEAVVITVGGTNGKGSTVAALDEIYSIAGYQVARYTSPHLVHFNERMVIHQQPVSDAVICDAFSKIHAFPESLSLTYFEMTTLAALLIFKQHPLDVILLEVGMGGRLDATNIIDADLSIITTIDLDHQAWLGNTREAIGFEKAGILRKHRPAIYADTDPPSSILEFAAQQQTALFRLNEDYIIQEKAHALNIIFNNQQKMISLPKPAIHLKAASAAIFASYQLRDKLPILPENWSNAMQNVRICGRQQYINGDKVLTLFDVAHNPQAVNWLALHVQQKKKGKVFAVFSGLKDKDLLGLIKPMREVVNVWYPVLLKGVRASTEAELEQTFIAADIQWPGVFSDPVSAYQTAIHNADRNDLVVVYGSFLTVGAIFSSLAAPT